MDLGAEICTPKNPSCLVCPVQQDCAANARGVAELLPAKAQKMARPSRYGVAFLVQRDDGAVLLRQRPEAGLLGGMLEVPSTHWGDAPPPKKEALRAAPVTTSWMPVPGTVVHVFTHFRLELVVYRALVPVDASFTLWAEQERCRWVQRRDLYAQALPSVMKKVIAHGMNAD
jgi:A/G-specific adenine glycosylase